MGCDAGGQHRGIARRTGRYRVLRGKHPFSRTACPRHFGGAAGCHLRRRGVGGGGVTGEEFVLLGAAGDSLDAGARCGGRDRLAGLPADGDGKHALGCVLRVVIDDSFDVTVSRAVRFRTTGLRGPVAY